MASLNFEPAAGKRAGGYRLQFRDVKKRKRAIWLGDVPSYRAEETLAHVEHLLDSCKRGRSPELATADWLAGIDDDFRNKLAKCGLCEPVAKRVARDLTLAAWIDEYIRDRSDVKPRTRLTYDRGKAKLVDHFGARKRLRDVTVADASKWRIWIKTRGNKRDGTKPGLSEETTRKMTGLAKLFFSEAVTRGLIPTNPFDGLPSTGQGNDKRQHFVAPETIELCMEHCPCVDWRTILALARFGGLRCPSELVALRWSDVDLPGAKMVINASKTEHHSSGGVRVCPIFGELKPYLEAAWDAAPEGSEFVITRYRQADQNLHATFRKILTRAGVAPWPRLFQNLRASRETELMARWPAKDVASWLGNSVPVAMRHYAMATDESFLAASDPTVATVTRKRPPNESAGGSRGGSISAIYGDIGGTTSGTTSTISPRKLREYLVKDGVGNYYLIGLEGLEPSTKRL